MSRIEKIREMLSTNGPDSFLEHALALELIKIGEDNQAVSIFTQLLDRQPDYVGSYYHLAKIYERIGQPVKAIEIYEKGMDFAQKAKDHHALNELRMAWEDLVD